MLLRLSPLNVKPAYVVSMPAAPAQSPIAPALGNLEPLLMHGNNHGNAVEPRLIHHQRQVPIGRVRRNL